MANLFIIMYILILTIFKYCQRTLVQESKLVLPWKKLSKMSKEARKREAQKIKSNMIISTEQEEQR